MPWKDDLGINGRNAWENLFSHSLLAAMTLDLAASAAGRIDVEAARYLRMAQGMVRKRLDILLGQAFYAPRKLVNGRETGLRVPSEPVPAFGKLYPVCSEDTAALAGADESAINDLGKVASHPKPEFDGALLDNLDSLIRVEAGIHAANPDHILETACVPQAETLGQLMNAAAVIADFIAHAARLLKEKLMAPRDLYVVKP